MTDFLREMAASSRARVAAARRDTPEARLREQSAAAGPVRPLPSGFLLIAEIKRISPAAGALDDARHTISRRAALYTAGGAAAISVLTESGRFGGSLEDLGQVAAAVQVPVMRKDFLVDPYQVLEARAHSASGILLIIKMLDDSLLLDMLSAARELGMFALVEAFDREDLDRVGQLLAGGSEKGRGILLGLNTRDLRDLTIHPQRLEELASCFPDGYPRIAESGVQMPDEVRRAAALGYDGVLVGTALMRAADPASTCRTMVGMGQSAHAARAASSDRGRYEL